MKSFTSARQKTGQLGEDIAERWLLAQGFTVIDRNYTVRGGEIDIIARRSEITHYIEVKSVQTFESVPQSYNPGENITSTKMQRLMTALAQYRSEHSVHGPWQLDALIIWLNPTTKQARIQWLQHINH